MTKMSNTSNLITDSKKIENINLLNKNVVRWKEPISEQCRCSIKNSKKENKNYKKYYEAKRNEINAKRRKHYLENKSEMNEKHRKHAQEHRNEINEMQNVEHVQKK
jgi:hypothetical protein